MSIADELKTLEDLRQTGALTDAEFAQAKTAVLAQPHADAAGEKLDEHLAAVRYQNELERLDREWAQEREKYMVTGRYGRRYIPTTGESTIGALVIGVFGAFWTVMAFGITSGVPDELPFSLAKVFFPLFGVAFTAFGIWSGIQAFGKAEEYKQAHAAYQRRRADVKADDFR